MEQNCRPIANPLVVLREEFDEWAVLLDPDTGSTFGLSPVGLFIWKCLDGRHSMDEIVEELKTRVEDLPEEVSSDVIDFVEQLVQRGLAGFDSIGAQGVERG